jgi:hypothetical protein
MELWRPDSDWRKMSAFRGLASQFYEELLPASVWLQTRSTVVIQIDVLISFFMLEMKARKETWMVKAAFDGLTAALMFCGSEIPGELLELALNTALRFPGSNEREILVNSAALLGPEPVWDSLRGCVLSFAMSVKFCPTLFAHLLKTDTRKTLTRFAFSIAQFFIRQFQQETLELATSNALFILLFDHSPKIMGPVCEFAIATKQLNTPFRLMLVSLFLRNAQNPILGSIPRYLLSVFRKGGMHLIGALLLSKPAIGIALLSQGAAKTAFLLALRDNDNVRAYIWFIQLALLTMEQVDPNLAAKFAVPAFRFCVKLIETWAHDALNGRMVVWHCIRVIKDALRSIRRSPSAAFDENERGVKELLVRILSQNIEIETQNQKLQTLVEFSRNNRARRQEDWGEMELEELDEL